MAAAITETAERLGARLKRVGAQEFAGSCPLCGGTDRFSINARKNLFNCRGCDVGGDAIDLVRHVNACSYHEALAFLGRDDAQPPKRAPALRSKPVEGDAFVRERIAAIIRELVPVRGTPGEAYLRETRKINTDAIGDVLERTDAIGWHPAVYFNEPGDDEPPPNPLHGKRLGCMVGVMSDPVTARPTGAISRTYITAGLKKVCKAKTLGSPVGIVRLTRDEDVLEGLVLAEGLETALDAMADGHRPMWSTGSTGLMAAFPVLCGVEFLTIFADHDESGAGERAAREAKARWRQAGRGAEVFMRDELGDYNDAEGR
jgi:phage/plasmid primase-like uncharacterized protein